MFFIHFHYCSVIFKFSNQALMVLSSNSYFFAISVLFPAFTASMVILSRSLSSYFFFWGASRRLFSFFFRNIFRKIEHFQKEFCLSSVDNSSNLMSKFHHIFKLHTQGFFGPVFTVDMVKNGLILKSAGETGDNPFPSYYLIYVKNRLIFKKIILNISI